MQFVDYEFKHPNLGSGEAAVDGRMMLLEISRGVGLPEFIVTADASNNNFASLREALIVAIQEAETWQEFFKEEFCEIFERVMRNEIKSGRLSVPENIKIECDFKFTVFDIRDILKEVQALNLLRANGVISKTTMASRFGYNFEDETEKMDAEQNFGNDFEFDINNEEDED